MSIFFENRSKWRLSPENLENVVFPWRTAENRLAALRTHRNAETIESVYFRGSQGHALENGAFGYDPLRNKRFWVHYGCRRFLAPVPNKKRGTKGTVLNTPGAPKGAGGFAFFYLCVCLLFFVVLDSLACAERIPQRIGYIFTDSSERIHQRRPTRIAFIAFGP